MTVPREVESIKRKVEVVHSACSPLIQTLRTCARVAQSNATVLVTGETGTGKEVIARYIHELSPRSDKPLVAVNCAAIPEALLESELFGFVRGAFTGAVSARRGRIALAEGGTLFLDEIGDLSLPLQVKLLRVLQERCYEPLGSAHSVQADFRLIAATHRDLAAEAEAGRFRSDLYYRLMVCPVHLPPLRERPGDVRALFAHFWQALGETRAVDPKVLAQLERYPWPGNVRELENLVERLSVCCEARAITLADLPAPYCPAALTPEPQAAGPLEPIVLARAPDPRPAGAREGAAPAGEEAPGPAFSGEDRGDSVAALPPLSERRGACSEEEDDYEPGNPAELASAVSTLALPVDLPDLLRRIEEGFINRALEATSGNRAAAASLLGLQRTTLVEKLRRRIREAPGT